MECDGTDLLTGDEADHIRKGLTDLNKQFLNELTDTSVGYAAYFLKEPIYCHPDSDLPCKADSLNEAVLLVLAALDAGVGKNPTDLVYRALTSSSWTRLTMAVLAAILRGHMRSPTNTANFKGSTYINETPDKFPIHPSLSRPTTEGGAIICMAEQLAGQLDFKRNRTFTDIYNKVWSAGAGAAEKLALNRLQALAQPSKNTIERTVSKAKKDLYSSTCVSMEANLHIRSEIEDKVRVEMFNVLNKEAFDNIEEWRESYKTEMLAAMRSAIGTTATVAPTNSQLVRNSEEAIRDEVNKRLTLIKEQTATIELEQWKNEYLNSAKLEFLDNEAAKLGYGIVRIADSIDRQGRPPKKANTGEKRTRSGSRSSRPPSPDPLTPPRLHLMDLEKTPTSTPVKGERTATYQGNRHKRDTASPTPLTSLLPSLPPVLDLPVSAMPREVTLKEQPPNPPMEEDLPEQLSQPRVPVIVYPAEHNLRSRPPHSMADTLARLTEPIVNITDINEPVPMERDYHGDLENRAFEIHGRLPGVSASMHAPSNRAAEEDPPALPSLSPQPSTQLSAEALNGVHPSVVQLFNHLQATLTTSFNNIFTRLDNQDRTITELSKAKDPRRKSRSTTPAPSAAPQEGGSLNAPPPSLPTHTSSSASAAEPITPTNVTKQGVEPVPLRRPGPPPVPRNTRPQTLIPPSAPPTTWNKIATQGTFHTNANIAQFAKNAAATQGRTTSGKRIPGKSDSQTSPHTTQVTVVRGRGITDEALESAVFMTPPEVIVQAARSQAERIAKNSITLLHGRWSINPKSHNFVYTIAGNIPYDFIYTFRNALIGPLQVGDLVPNKGWTYAQLRNVPTSDSDGVVFSPDTLLNEIRRNAAFANTIFCTAPHWQANPANVANYPSSTVTMAYVDETGTQTEAAKRGGIYMFNTQVRFVPTGDHPSITQCGRCHEIGHHTDTPACPLPKNAVRCYICGGSHIGTQHSFHCTGPHKTAGKCDCGFKCLLCKGKHHARARNCPVRGGFPPPTLATTGSPPSKPLTAAERKAEEKDTTTTQRDEGFTKVEPKRLSRNKRAALKRANTINKANASIPGSSSFARIDDLDDPAPAPDTHPDDIIFPHSDMLAGPDETFVAFQNACSGQGEEKERNLRLANAAWGGSEEDTMLTNLASLPARYAVKHNLPLTDAATRERMISGLQSIDADTYINTMANKWGGCFPLNFTVEQLPTFVRFACEDDETPPAPQSTTPSNDHTGPYDPLNPQETKMYTILLLRTGDVLLHNQRIPFELTSERVKHILSYAGSSLNMDNIQETILNDFATRAPTSPGTWN